MVCLAWQTLGFALTRFTLRSMKNLHVVAGLVSGVVALAAFVPYVRSILRGQTRPSIASWWIWTAVGACLCASYFSVGARTSIWTPIGYVIGPFGIAILSFFYGQKGKTWIDSFCLLAAAVSLFLWWQTGSAKLALGLNILVDACGAIPTLRKSWQQPESEDRAAWFLFLLAGVLNVIAVTPWTWATAVYPLYLVLNSGVMNLILLRKT